jgi:hypothetical protein
MKSLAWATALTGVSLWLFAACARMDGTPITEMRDPVNQDDLDSDFCVDTCEPDYGSMPVNCAHEEAGIEFFPAPIWDFEGFAERFYSYQDKSTNYLVTNTCIVEGPDCDPNQYEPLTYPTDRCGEPGTVTGSAIHVRGGPFHEWGGGIGRRLEDLATKAAANVGATCSVINSPPGTAEACEAAAAGKPLTPDNCASMAKVIDQSPTDPAFCPDPDTCIDCAPGATLADGSVQPMVRRNYYAAQVDLREWEGISFWARRGPDSMPTIRVAIGDRNTDDDMSFLMTNGGLEPRCRRKRECACRDQNRQCRALESDSNQTWCFNPELGDIPPDELPSWTTPDEIYEPCGDWACDYRYPAYPDDADIEFTTPNYSRPLYVGENHCQDYIFPSDTSSLYCYPPNSGKFPASGLEECGDPWSVPVRLNPDWTFHTIPFTELHQDGYGKEFPKIDLEAVSLVRFLWGPGWIDYWIDDVRFYRRKP